MALRYLWIGWPWRGPVEARLEAGLREIVGLFGTPGWHWSICGQGDRGDGMIDDGFATPGWHWSTCGQGGRGEGMIDDGFATPGWL